MNGKFYTVLLVAVVAGLVTACSGGSAPTELATAAPIATEVATQLPVQETATAEATTAPQETAAPQETTAAPAAGGSTFVIDPAQSAAHFLINEVLLGQPKLVDGVTNMVKGQIVADYANPSTVTVSPIRVDLTGLTTDSTQRTGTLHRSILETGNPANQFAIFTTTKLDGLPDTVTIGQSFDFKITGDLALHGVTKEVTFDATVTPVSETQLSGTASLKIIYGDWGVQILRLPPQVASVEDNVILKLDFVANAQ